ncbi:MAG: NADPH-dependent F420 reductase [bacterium]|nr:NADPH-dependent F420 reductase [bacterium]
MQIGILGGTGPVGRALCARLASVGYRCVLGSRLVERATDTCAEVLAKWPGRTLPLVGACNTDAAQCDVVVVATPWDVAASTVNSVSDELSGKVVISMANALTKVGKQFQPLVLPEGSVAATVQAAVPKALVAATLHHVPAHHLGDLNQPVDCDVLVCSDHPEATATTLEIMGKLPGVRSFNAGSLIYAGPVEAFTAVLLQLNTAYQTKTAIRFTGLDAA